MGGGDSGGGANTVTQTQQIPEYQQAFSQENQDIARALGSQPFPTYQGATVAPMNDLQRQGIQTMAANANWGIDTTNAGVNATQSALGPVSQYMDPYVQSALQPQLTQLGMQQAGQQHQIDAAATGAGAFGDARHGVQSSTNDYLGQLATSGVEAQGFDQAFQRAQQQQQVQLAGAGQLAQMGQLQQQMGQTAGQSLWGAGSQQQQQDQQQLSQSYANFWNQVNWPQEMLNMRLSALSNSPYSTTRITTLPQTSSTAQNLGAFGALAGGIGSLSKGSGTQASSLSGGMG